VSKRDSQILQGLLDQGFELVSGNTHWKLRAPDGTMVTACMSMGRGRALLNFQAYLRRMGYDLFPPKRGSKGRSGRS
jgi:hypothetical protein